MLGAAPLQNEIGVGRDSRGAGAVGADRAGSGAARRASLRRLRRSPASDTSDGGRAIGRRRSRRPLSARALSHRRPPRPGKSATSASGSSRSARPKSASRSRPSKAAMSRAVETLDQLRAPSQRAGGIAKSRRGHGRDRADNSGRRARHISRLPANGSRTDRSTGRAGASDRLMRLAPLLQHVVAAQIMMEPVVEARRVARQGHRLRSDEGCRSTDCSAAPSDPARIPSRRRGPWTDAATRRPTSSVSAAGDAPGACLARSVQADAPDQASARSRRIRGTDWAAGPSRASPAPLA